MNTCQRLLLKLLLTDDKADSMDDSGSCCRVGDRTRVKLQSRVVLVSAEAICDLLTNSRVLSKAPPLQAHSLYRDQSTSTTKSEQLYMPADKGMC